jgi:hypothetical protein
MEIFMKDLSEKFLKIELASLENDEIVAVSKFKKNFIIKTDPSHRNPAGIGEKS